MTWGGEMKEEDLFNQIAEISGSIKRNDNFILEINKKAEIANSDILAAITALNDNLSKYNHLNSIFAKGEQNACKQ